MRKHRKHPSASATHWKSKCQALAAVQYECKVCVDVGGGQRLQHQDHSRTGAVVSKAGTSQMLCVHGSLSKAAGSKHNARRDGCLHHTKVDCSGCSTAQQGVLLMNNQMLLALQLLDFNALSAMSGALPAQLMSVALLMLLGTLLLAVAAAALCS
jgi:hypothetical protein